ncbi:MAG: hypothetical protein QOG02_1409 [Gaiellales bacterium]|nr:hypothetical protein [Gaiellales bacterium]
MGTGPAIAVAVAFVWLGMVLAISFLEAPLKFRALNTVELGLAIVILALTVAGPMPTRIVIAFGVAFAALAVQLIAVRPRLTRRSDMVLAGSDAPRSRGHYAYVGLEVVKAAALIVAGILLLTA